MARPLQLVGSEAKPHIPRRDKERIKKRLSAKDAKNAKNATDELLK